MQVFFNLFHLYMIWFPYKIMYCVIGIGKERKIRWKVIFIIFLIKIIFGFLLRLNHLLNSNPIWIKTHFGLKPFLDSIPLWIKTPFGLYTKNRVHYHEDNIPYNEGEKYENQFLQFFKFFFNFRECFFCYRSWMTSNMPSYWFI